MLRTHHTNRFIVPTRIAVLLALTLAACQDPSEVQVPLDTWSHPIQHQPFTAVPLADGPNGEDGRWIIAEAIAAADGNPGDRISEVRQVRVRQLSPAELNIDKAAGTPDLQPETLPAGPATVLISVVAPSLEARPMAALRAVADGRVTTREEAAAERESWVLARARANAAGLDELASHIESLGGQVVGKAPSLGILHATLDGTLAEGLRARPEVTAVNLVTRSESDAIIGGRQIMVGSQAHQLVLDGYDGENAGQPYDQTAAIIEVGGFDDSHVLFDDTAGGVSRVRGMFQCDSPPCFEVSSFGDVDDHAQAVSQIVAGDLMDGQDGNITQRIDQIHHTGMAPEARLWMYGDNAYMSDIVNALEHAVTQFPAPSVANMSLGSTGDPSCEGRTSTSQAVNAAFESGLLVVKSAGNNYNVGTDCSVSEPAAAIGAFVVGAHGDSHNGSARDVKTDPISDFSSRGPANGRSIVDLTSYGYRSGMADSSGGYTYDARGTSFAAPTVTGIALDLRDHYLARVGVLIEEPGILHTALLLLGDRQAQGGTLASGYDPEWGAGRVGVRRFDTEGLDWPYGYWFGMTCVGDGEEVSIDINGGAPLDADVDAFKAVAYWYDARHGTTGELDDIDLAVKQVGVGNLVSSISGSDEKERVYTSSAGGKAVELNLTGYRVSADSAGCGANSMLVYWAYYYEDTDRDDVNGPSANIGLP